MNHVIRRMILPLLVALALASCAADERDALRVGDQSISEAGLTDLVIALTPGGPDPESVAVLDAAAYREVGATWLQLFATFDYLETRGVVLGTAERDAAKGRIEQLIVEGRLGALSREGEAWEALVVSDFLSTQPALEDTEQTQQAIESLLRDSDVASRIGTYQVDTGQIVQRG